MTKRRSRRKPEQIVKLLQEDEAMLAAGKTLGEVYQKLSTTKATWMRWKKQYGGLKSEEAKRLRELELENRRPKASSAKPDGTMVCRECCP